MWADRAVAATQDALRPLADSERAPQMQRYMKDVAPFLGIGAKTRRAAQRQAWRVLPPPDRIGLLETIGRLWDLDEREFQYAGGELLGMHLDLLVPDDLDHAVKDLLVSKSWWDTVDLLGSAAVTPLVDGSPELVAVMWEWNASDDQWLVRASIQHQRGLRGRTDAARLLGLCRPHVRDRRFFVAKAIGWALRDLTRDDPQAVAGFLTAHPDLSPVASREARRGLERAAGAGGVPAIHR